MIKLFKNICSAAFVGSAFAVGFTAAAYAAEASPETESEVSIVVQDIMTGIDSELAALPADASVQDMIDAMERITLAAAQRGITEDLQQEALDLVLAEAVDDNVSDIAEAALLASTFPPDDTTGAIPTGGAGGGSLPFSAPPSTSTAGGSDY